MSVCCINSCKNNYNNNRNVHYYRFPLNKKTHRREKQIAALQQRMAWINVLKGNSSMTLTNIQAKRVCSGHFVSGVKADCMDKQNPAWSPSIDLCGIAVFVDENESELPDTIPNEASDLGELEFDHSVIEKETEEIQKIISSVEECDEQMNVAQSKIHTTVDKETLHNEILSQARRIDELQKRLLMFKFDVESFRANNEKTLYYTGIPTFSTLETIFRAVERHIPRCSQNSLSKAQMLVLSLMKLRLGLHFYDLGYRFDISHTTASRIFYTVIDVLYHRFGSVVSTPNRDDVKMTMPSIFKQNFGGDVVYIIDCPEIFIEVPSSPETSVLCWSSYKRHHTVKFLIAISPQGAIVFISCLFGGRASDVFITNNCGFFNILLPNDYVLADKGMKLDDIFEMQQARLVTPAFVYKQRQLHPLEVEDHRKIANVRVHVERVIGPLKRNFLLLHHIIPMSMLAENSSDETCMLDKIVKICCALCNLCPPIVGNENVDLPSTP